MRMLAVILVGLASCVLICAAPQSEMSQPLQATALQPAASQPASRGPTALWTYPGVSQIHSMVLTPDGKHAYVSMTVNGINLWKLLVYYWPEWSGAILLVVLFCVFRRTVKHEQEAGQPHCRLCNYQLTNLEAEACPECGGKLTRRNRVMGTRKRWTMAALLATTAVIVLGYMQFADSSQRGQSIHRWFNWSSTWLDEWARTENWVWLLRASDLRHHLSKIELEHGQEVEGLLTELGGKPFWRIVISPDDRVLAGLTSGFEQVVFVRAEDGDVIRIDGEEQPFEPVTVGFDPAGDVAYVANEWSQVWRCDFANCRWQQVRIEEGNKQLKYNVAFTRDSACVLEVETVLDDEVAGKYHMLAKLVDFESGGEVVTWRVPDNGEFPKFASEDGRWLYSNQGDGVVHLFDVATRAAKTITAASNTWHRFSRLSPGGRLMVLAGNSSILVVDCETDRKLAHIMSPALWFNDIDVHADQTRLFQCIVDPADGRGKIAVYSLPEITPATASNGFGEPNQP